MIDSKVSASMNNFAEERKKFSMSPVKRARQALATEPDDGLDSAEKRRERKDSSDEAARERM